MYGTRIERYHEACGLLGFLPFVGLIPQSPQVLSPIQMRSQQVELLAQT